jgi:CRP-like cAMP-binding protein
VRSRPCHRQISRRCWQVQPVPAKRGETIIQQGDPGDYYYLIESGRCKVSRLVAGSPVQLAELKEGDAFGEEALVADTVRNATVVMNTDGMLLRLSKQDFNDLLRAPLLQKVAGEEAERRLRPVRPGSTCAFRPSTRRWLPRARSTFRSMTFGKRWRRSIRQGNTLSIARRDVAVPPPHFCFPSADFMRPCSTAACGRALAPWSQSNEPRFRRTRRGRGIRCG